MAARRGFPAQRAGVLPPLRAPLRHRLPADGVRPPWVAPSRYCCNACGLPRRQPLGAFTGFAHFWRGCPGVHAGEVSLPVPATRSVTAAADARAGVRPGGDYQGRRLSRYRRRQARKRAELQARRTRSATRRLARRLRKEHRHATGVNHRISKEIVSVAQRTGRGIAVEALGGIRERVRPRCDQRGALSSWPFHQLGQHLAYKARKAGVPFLEVDAAYTSQRCPRCGHTERANRSDRDRFRCRRCGLAGPADVVAGVNVRNRARSAWVFVTAPAPSL
ncbi:transposase [Streptomyces sp. NPDC020125]|uniref:transposase n=1 Tax=Streptomyces sp. NPDC020125 TaxID=3154593 RepID=UPI0033F8CF55